MPSRPVGGTALRFQKPAPQEVSPFLQAGGGARLGPRSEPVGTLGAGVEWTFPVFTFVPDVWAYQLPGAEPRRLSPEDAWWSNADIWHLRAGPWAGFETTIDRSRVEGGLALNLGSQHKLSLADFGVRVGGGYATSRAGYVVGALSWGPRYVGMREHPDGNGPPVALACGIRMFAAVRDELAVPGVWDLTLGVEVEPICSQPRSEQ